MTKFFLAERLGKSSVLPFIKDFFSDQHFKKDPFFTYTNNVFVYKNFNIVSSLDLCDFILIPQAIRSYDGEYKKYINFYIEIGKKTNKKVIVFLAGDLHHDIFIDQAIVFKSYNYRRYLNSNEICIPIHVEDIKDRLGKDIELRKKDHLIPVVGFCGWAGFQNFFRYLLYLRSNLYVDFKKKLYGDNYLEVFKRGLYFRRKSIKTLRKSSLVKALFIIKNNYYAHNRNTLSSPEKYRNDFIKNIIDSDFVLCPKGDANASARFYEAMSLGRIPVLIDTDIVLPLEVVIDYSKLIIRVPYEQIKDLPKIILNFYNSMSQKDFEKIQLANRHVYEKYLRYDVFLSYVFERLNRLNQGWSLENFLKE